MSIIKGAGYVLLAIVVIATMFFSIAFLSAVGFILGLLLTGILMVAFTAFCLKMGFELRKKKPYWQ